MNAAHLKHYLESERRLRAGFKQKLERMTILGKVIPRYVSANPAYPSAATRLQVST